MAAPATGAPPPPRPRERGGDLVVEWRGPHTLIRRRDELPGAADVLGTIPWVPGNVLVLVSATAHRHPSLSGVVRDWLAQLRSTPGGAGLQAVWLAVPDLGDTDGMCGPWMHGLAVDFDIDVIAPDGPLTTTVGAGLYVNRAEGGTGWRRFGPRGQGDVVGCRFPVPAWEHQLPRGPVTAAGLVTATVPAGLAVRPAGLPAPGHMSPVFRVPMHARIPKLIVGQPGVDVPAKAVAEILGHVPEPLRRALLVVPVSASAVAPEWAAELAELLGEDVMLTAGLETINRAGVVRTVVLGPQGQEVLVPLAAMLRHRAGAAAPEVVDIAPAPPGWEKHGSRCYRRAGDRSSSLLAEVLPGGLHVHSDAEQPVFTTRLDSPSWTLAIGGEGQPVTEAELAAVRELLGGLAPHQCRTAQVRVLGTAEPAELAALGAHVRSVGATLQAPPRQESEDSSRTQRIVVAKPVHVPVVVTASPVATVSGPVATQPEPKPEPKPEPVAPQAEPEPEPVTSAKPREPVDLADRPSTPAEQARLATSAGALYTEALAAVNVALSAWPMLKPEAKADLVAVCLYLGRGEGGATALADALAEGREPFDGYLPCLVSGLRRLPTHRKVVLRQENTEHAEGTVLTEPGFLSASLHLDVTTGSARIDHLIWPVAARRTSELVMGRTFDEVVFPVGRRFKVLATKTGDGGPSMLSRELLPDEDPQSPEALERDRTVLPRLERAWRERQTADLRLIEEPDALARLTTPLEADK
ncbi:hypothetical protein [Lentzea terrae]|uniref:hypothetical protein n=1 Tax=Lentzea terrae TaxID=2200761 RepID=UPI0013003725|nr:hypothetical protein [Lentzea terrae]